MLPELSLASTPEDAVEGADAIVIATDWPEYRDLDWAALRDVAARALIVNSRRLLDPDVMTVLGYRYEAVGTRGLEPRSEPNPRSTTATSK